MPLSLGLIGLPNAGKSTIFNVLAQQPLALTASYPFSTVDPNRVLVDVPDQRLEVLGALTGQQRRVKVKLEVVDIAGLVSGASRGEGLGNQFLDQTRHCDALVHVVGCFGPSGAMDATGISRLQADLDIVNQELMLSDLILLEGKAARLEQAVKNDPSLKPQLHVARSLQADLESGLPVKQSTGAQGEAFRALDRELRFISLKPELILINLDEAYLADLTVQREIREAFAGGGQQVAALCALLEEEIQDLSEDEQKEYRKAYNLQGTGLQRIVAQCFDLLGLVRFYTLGDEEVRAWAVSANCRAVEGAGRIHTDFARGFIAAEVISYERLVEVGSEKNARAAGQLKVEGHNYTIQDGDVIRFRFNV